MSADKLIRGATAGVVLAVAGFAAVISYSHIYDLARLHGQSGSAARLLPLSVDGLILAASLVMLHEARNGRSAPHLARWMLAAGVGATVGSNVLYGVPYGALGALLSAWPALSFIGSVEMMMALVRRARPAAAAPDALTNGHAAPEGGREAAEMYADDLAAGELPSVRQIRRQMHIGQPRAQQVRAYLGALTNGHSPSS